MPELHTTFNLLTQAGACGQQPCLGKGYNTLARALGGTTAYGKNTPIPLSRIVESNGLDDALWCLRAVLPEEVAMRDRLSYSLGCDYAERVLPIWEAAYPTKTEIQECLLVTRRFGLGLATADELRAAGVAAETAAAAAGNAAWVAARAARNAAGNAAWAAAEVAAWAAGNAAGAARNAAWAAGGVAAWAAAGAAAAAAANAAKVAAGAAAGVAAEDAERQWQMERFLAVLKEEVAP